MASVQEKHGGRDGVPQPPKTDDSHNPGQRQTQRQAKARAGRREDGEGRHEREEEMEEIEYRKAPLRSNRWATPWLFFAHVLRFAKHNVLAQARGASEPGTTTERNPALPEANG